MQMEIDGMEHRARELRLDDAGDGRVGVDDPRESRRRGSFHRTSPADHTFFSTLAPSHQLTVCGRFRTPRFRSQTVNEATRKSSVSETDRSERYGFATGIRQ